MREDAQVYLRVELTGESDPDDFCSGLNVEPVHTWYKGDLRRDGSVRDTSGFRAELASDLDWRSVLVKLVDTLRKHRVVLKSSCQDGASWALEIVLYVGGSEAYARCIDMPTDLLETVCWANGTVVVYAYPCSDKPDLSE